MSYENKIQTLEKEIKELGNDLCEILLPLMQPNSLSALESDFLFNHYSEAIAMLEWHLEEQLVILPEPAIVIWTDIKNKADSAKHLYKLKLQSDDGFKNPITHMNSLMNADAEIPDGFGKRYGLNKLAVKCLWLTDPAFEEPFTRRRIGAAVARNGSRSGHYLFTQRRYKLTQKQAQRLVDDMWESPTAVSKVFYELLDWKKLVSCRITEEGQKEVLKIHSEYST